MTNQAQRDEFEGRWAAGYKQTAFKAFGAGQIEANDWRWSRMIMEARAAEDAQELLKVQIAVVAQMQASTAVQQDVARSTRWLALATGALAVFTAWMAMGTWRMAVAQSDVRHQTPVTSVVAPAPATTAEKDSGKEANQ